MILKRQFSITLKTNFIKNLAFFFHHLTFFSFFTYRVHKDCKIEHRKSLNYFGAHMKNSTKCSLILLTILGISLAAPSWAALTQLSEETLSNSEEPFSRRIYSYDFDVTKDGIIHAVYAKPVPNENRTQIIYATKPVDGVWPSEGERTILEEYGFISSISTYIIIDDNTGIIHICYIVERDFADHIGLIHNQGLVYQTIENGIIGEQINISSGAFHTRMQIDKQGRAIFAREYEIFLTANGTLLTPPFPKALRIQLPITDNQWTDKKYVLQLPSPTADAEDYRLSNFIYDKEQGRYHLTYGDKNAVFLRNSYPTTNPPVTSDKTPVPFPEGAGHKLWYAYSDDLKTWSTFLIDSSGNISENEFWTDLILNNEKTPYVASFRYKTDDQGVQQGSTNIIGNFTGGAWKTQTVAGKTTGASPSRAGMGAKLTLDTAGRFHAVWDSSPDKPIDGESGVVGAGTTMYRFSPDGEDWAVRQVLLPYSAEGQCRVKIHNNQYLLMVLGDALDTRLIFAQFEMPTSTANLFEISTDKMFYAPDEAIKLHARLQQGTENIQGDAYIVVGGPYNIDSAGNLEAITTTQFSYFGSDMLWHTFVDFSKIQPLLLNFPLIDFNADFLAITAGTPPFDKPARYMIYSVVNAPDTSIGDFKTSLFSYMLHICSQPECGEL